MIILFLILASLIVGCTAISMHETKQVVSAYEDKHYHTLLNELREERQEIYLIEYDIQEIKILLNDMANKQ